MLNDIFFFFFYLKEMLETKMVARLSQETRLIIANPRLRYSLLPYAPPLYK